MFHRNTLPAKTSGSRQRRESAITPARVGQGFFNIA